MNAHLRFPRRRSPLAPHSRKRIGAWLTASLLAAMQGLDAQTTQTFTETFTGTTAQAIANGWIFGGGANSTSTTADDAAYLTGGVSDAVGSGWLRLTTGGVGNQSTYALLDSQIFSVGAQIQITMDYAFYNAGGNGNGTAADGITFFLIDGSTTASSFSAGAYGGSLGYAQKTAESGAVGSDIAGMTGAYLGFGFDNFGNYSNGGEGREGGVYENGTLVPNSIAVRGPGSGTTGYEYIAGAQLDNSTQSMDIPTSTTRPSQTGSTYRSFRLTLDANNLLIVEMKFGSSSDWTVVFTADLSTFDRPETLKLGFTGSTGDYTETQEIRNLIVTSTPLIYNNFEWDAGADTSWSTGVNWVGDSAPTTNGTGDILFRNASPNVAQTVNLTAATAVRSLNFESTRNHTLTGSTITLGDGVAGNSPSINVTQSGAAIVHHKINNAITLVEATRISNIGNAVLCLNGIYTTAGNATYISGDGSVNFNGTIVGAGAITKAGSGITTLNANNSGWTGALTINEGVVAITNNGALGTTAGATTVNSGGALFLRGGTTASPRTISEPLTLSGSGVMLRGGGMSGALHADGGPGSVNTVTGAITLAGDAAIGGRAGSTLNLNGVISGSGRSLTKVGEGLAVFGANNTYTGATIIEGGALRASNTNQIDGNLVLNGGVLEITSGFGTFTRGLGTGTSNVQWTGDGGFSASGAAMTVNIGGGTALTWGGTNFVGDNKALLLSSAYSDNNITLSNAINLGGTATTLREIRVANGTATTGAATLDGTLSGVLSGVGGINKTGSGTLSLTGSNTFDGDVVISGGALRVAAGTALGSYSADAASKTADAATNLSTSARQGFNTRNQLTFSNVTGLVVGQGVTGTDIPAGTTITAISGNTITLSQNTDSRLSSGSSISFSHVSGNTVIALASTSGLAVGQTITGTNIPAGTTITAISGSTITLSNGLTGNLTGGSTLSFGALTHDNNIALNGGVLELASGYGTFTRSLGTGDNSIQWTGDGGFSAYGAAATVNIGGGTSLTWGNTASFVGANNKLLLGSDGANNTVTLSNALNLGTSGTRTIKVTAGTTSGIASGALSGVVSGAAALAVTGNGRLDLTAANTFSGALAAIGSEVRLSGSGTLATTSITVKQGATLTLDNTGTNNTGRVSDSAAVNLNGGALQFLGNSSAASSETIGTVTLSGGANTITNTNGSGRSSVLTAASLARNAGATVNFTNITANGTLGTTGNNPRVTFTTAPTALLNDGVLAFATINGTDFANYGTNGIVAATLTASAASTNRTNWTSGSLNVSATDDQTLGATSTVNALKLGNGVDITQAGYSLTVESGGLLTTSASTGAAAVTISGGTLTAGSNELILHTYNTVGTDISSVIAGSGGLTKSGTGSLTLSGTSANTYTGTTTVNDGVLNLAKSANTTAITGNLVVGDGGGQDKVVIKASEQIADTATVTLRGGEVGNSANVATLAFDDSIGSVTESFSTLRIEGNSVLDFSGGNPCSPTYLILDVLTGTADSLLTITNWIEFTDYLLVKKDNFNTDTMPTIVFEGYPDTYSWVSYDSTYYQIVPVPEPASTGLLALGGLTGFALLRRRRRAA